MELMVWLDHSGPPQPIGAKVATVSLLGATWDVWAGNIGWSVVSYVRQSPTNSTSFPVGTFFDDVVDRGYGERAWFLTSVQAGFEPWTGGANLAVTSFSAGASADTAASSSTAQTSVTAQSSGSSSGSSVCTAAYRVDASWSGGQVATVTVTNLGPATSSWEVQMDLPAGETVTNLWNGGSAGSEGAITVRNADYNGYLRTGDSATSGMQLSTSGTGPTADSSSIRVSRCAG